MKKLVYFRNGTVESRYLEVGIRRRRAIALAWQPATVEGTCAYPAKKIFF